MGIRAKYLKGKLFSDFCWPGLAVFPKANTPRLNQANPDTHDRKRKTATQEAADTRCVSHEGHGSSSGKQKYISRQVK